MEEYLGAVVHSIFGVLKSVGGACELSSCFFGSFNDEW